MENLNEQRDDLKTFYEHEKSRLILADKVKDIKIAMLATIDGLGIVHSRPMYTQEIKDDGIIWFFTGKGTKSASDIRLNPNINLAYSDPADNLYLSVTGLARMTEDPLKINELWHEGLVAWFPEGKNDPDIALIRIDVTEAEYWDAPNSKIAQIIGFVKASLTGKEYRPGMNEKLDL
ncbi:MAG: pyridoxamine 5'-phosphate oxidase family protein [Sphingobacteriaceae bacterium]